MSVDRDIAAIRTALVGLEGEADGGLVGDVKALREDLEAQAQGASEARGRMHAKLDRALRTADRASWWARGSLAVWPLMLALTGMVLGAWRVLRD